MEHSAAVRDIFASLKPTLVSCSLAGQIEPSLQPESKETFTTYEENA